MRKISALALVAFWLIGLQPLEAGGYAGTRREWTRSKEWFSKDNLQANLVWHATYFSDSFRGAYIKEHSKRKYLDPVATAQYTTEQEQKQAAGHEFFLGVYTKKDYKQLSLGKESFWELVLVTEGGEALHPVKIEELGVTPYEKLMFPYLDNWSKAYRVVFPKAELGDSFRLTMRSVLGDISLRWR